MRFRPNTHLRAGDLNALGELVERQALQGAAAGQYNNGVGVVVRNPRRQPSSTVRHAIMQDEVCLAVVNSGSALAGYSVSLYANGLDAAPTGTGTLYVPECSAYSSRDLPAGTVLLAHSTMVVATGGSET